MLNVLCEMTLGVTFENFDQLKNLIGQVAPERIIQND